MKVEKISESQLESRAIELKKQAKTPRSRSKTRSKPAHPATQAVETNYAEGIISLDQINLQGCMKKVNEVSIEMIRRFIPSKDGNMTLTRSTDKKVFSITNFDRYDPSDKFFLFQAWRINLKKWLPHSGSLDKLNEGLNQYFKKVVNNFEKLVQVQLVCQCHYVLLEYVEKELTNDEMDALVMKIFKYSRSGANEQGATSEDKVRRKVKKYVFFNVDTGEILFEYGGINKKTYTGTNPDIQALLFDPENINQDQKKIFELSLKIKEIKEEKFKSRLVFYYTGDFLNENLKE
jgi:hypothetical protein